MKKVVLFLLPIVLLLSLSALAQIEGLEADFMLDAGLSDDSRSWLEEEPKPEPEPEKKIRTEQPRAVSTFECIGLYWRHEAGGEKSSCIPFYREAGEKEWREAFPLWFDARNGEYRGSIVNLLPGTKYEIELRLGGELIKTNLEASTWSEAFPIAKRIELSEHSNEKLIVTNGGSPTGYTLYAPAPDKAAVIDGENRLRQGVEVRASYVIIRGLKIVNPAAHGILLQRDVHDIVIEECDISGWGRVASDGYGEEYDAAIFASSKEYKPDYRGSCPLTRVIIQRNKLHHPRSKANSWGEPPRPGRSNSHPAGPQAIVLGSSAGNHVIRYNEIYSDEGHCFNDGMGAWVNHSSRGFPNRDSDIYGNIIRDCWDDAIEAEGANCNVRIWGNFLDRTYVAVATASTSIGPLYVWRNVSGVIRGSPNPPYAGGFLKTNAKGGGGKIYFFHNTVLQPPPASGWQYTRGASLPLGWCPMLNVMSRNNILQTSDYKPHERCSIFEFGGSALGDYDYDLYNAALRIPEGNQVHGIKGTPIYDDNLSLPEQGSGSALLWLSADSPGLDSGQRLKNFNDDFTGTSPDIGAHESGTAQMEFGVNGGRGL